MKRLILPLILLLCLFSCGQHLPIGMKEDLYCGQEIGGSLVIAIENFSVGSSRSITPPHITPAELVTQYDFKVSGTTGFQSFPEEAITIDNSGRGVLRKIPEGEWELTLTAYNKTNNTATLRGRTSISVTAVKTTYASFILRPVMTGNGTVNVQFTIPQSVVSRLEGNPKEATVALYYSEVDSEVPGTLRKISLPTAGGTVAYTANQIPEGQYLIKLMASYIANNSSTLNVDWNHTLYWEDMVYVESNLQSTAVITISESMMGIPHKTAKRNTRTTGGNSGTDGFTNPVNFNPWGETLWLYAAAWDGNSNDVSSGNEVLVVNWEPVFNADYYELELLLHPYIKYGVSSPSGGGGGRFTKVAVTDTEWDTIKNQTFTNALGGQTSKPIYMRFSGGVGDPDHYLTRVYRFSCLDSNNNVSEFVSCADKTLARTLFPSATVNGAVNARYTIAQSRDTFDDRGQWSYQGRDTNKIGLEGECGVLPVLLPGFAPKVAVMFRVRGVNEYGYGEWVYWKGGKW